MDLVHREHTEHDTIVVKNRILRVKKPKPNTHGPNQYPAYPDTPRYTHHSSTFLQPTLFNPQLKFWSKKVGVPRMLDPRPCPYTPQKYPDHSLTESPAIPTPQKTSVGPRAKTTNNEFKTTCPRACFCLLTVF